MGNAEGKIAYETVKVGDLSVLDQAFVLVE